MPNVRRWLAALALLALPATLAAQQGAEKQAAPLAVRMADAVIARNPIVHKEWDYTAGVVLLALDELGRRTGRRAYADYVRRNIDAVVLPDGRIRTYELAEFNLDQIAEGRVLFSLYQTTRDERYRKAIELLREQLRRQPRTSEGGFWHKQVYPHQMWLDGIYMAAPFLAQYAVTFGDSAALSDVTKQILLVARHTRDSKTGLYYHGWDESRTQIWADSLTGRSPNFWGRALGWYAMALVDVLDYLPPTHPDHAAVAGVLRDLATAVAAVQDPVTGLWYQVLDQPGRKGNYHEASASSMFAYALAKGVRKGYLGAAFRTSAQRGFDGIVRNLVRVDADGMPSLDRIVAVSGLGGKQQRDGSFEYYVREPVVSNDYKGVGPFILASIELESIEP